MDKDYIRYKNKVKNSNNVYHPTRMRLRKKLGKSSDDCERSSREIIQLVEKLPNKIRNNITIELCNGEPKTTGNHINLFGQPILLSAKMWNTKNS